MNGRRCQRCGYQAPTGIEPQSFNVSEAARYLGIARMTFYELRASRFIPFVKLPGGGIRFRRTVLDKLLKDLEVKTPQEQIERNDRRRKL